MAVNCTDNISLFVTCGQWDQSFEIVHTNALKASYLWCCILNGILAVHTFVLNLFIVVLFFKDRHLQTTANVLILALALSDLAVALLTQPAAIVNNALRLHKLHSCLSELTTLVLNEFVVGLSAWTVCVNITFERLLAICWPFKHRVIVTKSLLMKIFSLQVAGCVVVSLIVCLCASLKTALAFQSGLIFFGATCVLVAYPCIFRVVHKRYQTVARKYVENQSQNSTRMKTSKDELGSKGQGSVIVSQNSKHANSLAVRVSHVSQNSKLESTNYTPQDSRVTDSPNDMSQNSKPRNKLSSNPPHSPKREDNLNEHISQNSNRNSLETVSHDSKHENVSHKSNGNELKTTRSGQDSHPSLHMAMKRSKQEAQVCKAMGIITGTLVLCFVPRMVIFQCLVADLIPMQTFYNYLGPWFDILACANSSLNPYIYFFYKKDISEGVKRILFGKKSANRNSARLPSIRAHNTTEKGKTISSK